MSYAKNMGKKIGRNTSKNLNGKYNQKRLDRAKQSDTNAFKTFSKRAIQKTVEASIVLIGNKIADKITEVSKKFTTKKNQKELQMRMIKKYLKKDMYLQKKGRKLLII